MRWIIAPALALFLAAALFIVSPFISVYQLARAVETRDAAAIEERVDFRAVRHSLARQLATAYAQAAGRHEDPSSPLSRVTLGAASMVIGPLLEPYATPEAIIAFLQTGWPGGQLPEQGAGARLPSAGEFVASDRLMSAWRRSQWRGFSRFILAVPHADPDRASALEFRFSGFGWRLVGVELPTFVKASLVREMQRRHSAEAR
jgi:hypothetical protein